MARRIIYCADGTWDTADNKTNVYTFYKALKTTAQQQPFYDDGVGSEGNVLRKLVGGAFGTGLWTEVKEGYTAIAQVYEAGDEVYLFGFSRGAYTARSLGGMIAAAGLPAANFDEALVQPFRSSYTYFLRRRSHRSLRGPIWLAIWPSCGASRSTRRVGPAFDSGAETRGAASRRQPRNRSRSASGLCVARSRRRS